MGDPEGVKEHPRQSPPRSVRRGRRSGSSRTGSSQRTRQRLRVLYFSLAAVWGFLAGTGAVLIGLSSSGRPVRLGSAGLALVAVAALLALLGGVVTAAGYRSASRRVR